MRKLRTRFLVGAAVATFAGSAAFAAVSMADGPATASTVALTTTTTPTTTSTPSAITTKTPTTLSITVDESAITAGHLDIISGTLTTGTAPNARRIVELYRYDAKIKKWIPARVNLTHKGGLVQFVVRPLATAEYELVYHGNQALAAAHSAQVTITVTS